MVKIFPLIVLFLAGLQAPAQAQLLGLELSRGSQIQSANLSASGDFNKADKKKSEDIQNIFNWDLSLARTTQETTSATSGTVKDNTNDFSFGLGMDRGALSLGLSFNYSQTPEENMSSQGPQVSLAYKFTFHGSNEDSDSFDPYLRPEIGFGYEDYTQTFEVTRVARRRNAPVRPITGKNTIGQKFSSVTLKYKPVSWFYARAGYKKYSYNKDVQDFTQYLDNQGALGAPTSGFSSALSGFYDSTIFGQLNFDFLDTWTLLLKRSVSKVALDKSENSTSRILISDDITPNWTVGVGADNFRSGSTGLSDTTALVNIDYSF